MSIPYYLKIGRASDLENKKERLIYRALEIFPGALSLATLILVVFLSWLRPLWVAVFITCFVIYWLLKTIYFSFHLRAAYQKMREYEKIKWLEKLSRLAITNNPLPVKSWKDIYHMVIIPMYKEPLEVVKPAIAALEKSDYPKDKIIVVLATEEKAGPAVQETAFIIKKEFGNKFFKFLITIHPSNLQGEIAGKGSNETWGARQAKELIIDHFKIPYENIIVSSLDADTCVFPKYFSCLAYHYLTAAKPTRTSFQPIPLFINNIWEATPISRVFSFSASFYQFMNQERPEKQTTFSSHSMSFRALVDVDFRQVNVVSDDSRIFWQCFLTYEGDYRVQGLYYPVAMDANVAPGLLKTLKNIYKQQRRWAYGTADIPYFLFGFLKSKKIPVSRKLSLGFEFIEGFWSWAVASILIFFLGWLPLVLGGENFSQTLFSYNLPIFLRNVLTVGMLGLVSSSYLSILLLPPKPPEYGWFKYPLLVLEWFLIPFTMIFFTSVPALDAQTRLVLGKYLGFWPTEKFRRERALRN